MQSLSHGDGLGLSGRVRDLRVYAVPEVWETVEEKTLKEGEND